MGIKIYIVFSGAAGGKYLPFFSNTKNIMLDNLHFVIYNVITLEFNFRKFKEGGDKHEQKFKKNHENFNTFVL